MAERITNLSAPPVVGRRYLVPTVEWLWRGDKPRAWPVFLPLHDDARFFDFKEEHYHADPRFIDTRIWRGMGADVWWDAGRSGDPIALKIAQRTPIAPHRRGDYARPLPPLVWRVMTCKRTVLDYQFSDAPAVEKLNEHYAGHQCKRARSGWVCPHQNWPMGSVEPDANGVITCPLHGLKVDAVSGVVLTPKPKPVPTFGEALAHRYEATPRLSIMPTPDTTTAGGGDE